MIRITIHNQNVNAQHAAACCQPRFFVLNAVNVALQEGVTIKDVDTSFKKSSLPDGSLVIDIGDLHAGEHKDLLVKLDLPEVPISSPHMPVLSLEARYVDITNACMETSQFAVTIARAATSLASQPCNSFVMQHVQRCRTINALQAASDMAAAGDLSR